MSRLWSELRVVGRLRSGVWVSDNFQKNYLLVGRLGSGVRVSANFQMFALTAREISLGGKLSRRGICPRGLMSRGDVLHSLLDGIWTFTLIGSSVG